VFTSIQSRTALVLRVKYEYLAATAVSTNCINVIFKTLSFSGGNNISLVRKLELHATLPPSRDKLLLIAIVFMMAAECLCVLPLLVLTFGIVMNLPPALQG
jgi:hypothetical protein